MLEQYNSSLLPVELNLKLDDNQGIVKQISNQQYEKTLAKARSLKPLKQLLNRLSIHSEFGIVQFLSAILRLYSNIGNTKSKKTMSERFPQMSIEQQQILTTLQQILVFQFNPSLLIKRLRVTQMQTNLLLLLLMSLYDSYISNNYDTSRVVEWMGIVYDSNFLKVCLDPRIKQTLVVLDDILCKQIVGQKQEIQILSMLQQITQNSGFYEQVNQNKQIDTIYVGFR